MGELTLSVIDEAIKRGCQDWLKLPIYFPPIDWDKIIAALWYLYGDRIYISDYLIEEVK